MFPKQCDTPDHTVHSTHVQYLTVLILFYQYENFLLFSLNFRRFPQKVDGKTRVNSRHRGEYVYMYIRSNVSHLLLLRRQEFEICQSGLYNISNVLVFRLKNKRNNKTPFTSTKHRCQLTIYLYSTVFYFNFFIAIREVQEYS